jgi:O-antigen ligase
MAFRLFLLYLLCVYLRPLEQFAPGLMALRPMLVLWGLTFVLSVMHLKQTKLFGAHPTQIWLLMGFWMSAPLSLIANRVWDAIPGSIGDLSTPVMLLCLVAFNVTSVKRLEITCKALAVAICLLCIQSMHGYYTGENWQTFVVRQAANPDAITEATAALLPTEDVDGVYLWRLRSVGFLFDPNDFAQMICVALPMLTLWWSPGRWLRNLILLTPPAGVLLHALYLTHSRGGMLGVAVIGVILFVHRVGLFKGGIAVGVAGFLALAASQIGGRGFSAKESSANQRLMAWYDGLEMLKSNPVFGVGYGNFTWYHERTAHNSFVLCFSELGFLGYLVWLSLIVIGFRCLIELISSADYSARKTGLMMACSLAAFLTCSWFLSRTYSPSLYVVLGLCFAAHQALMRGQTRAPAGARHSLKKGWFSVSLGLAVLTVVGVSMFVRSAN